MIQLQKLQHWNVKIPLRFQFSQSNNATSISDSVLLKITSQNGIDGYGEACPRSYVTGESYASVAEDLENILPFLQAQKLDSIQAIKVLVTELLPGKIGLSSICAIELALLDIWSKEKQVPLFHALKGEDKEIKYSGIIPLVKPKYLELVFQQLKLFGFEQVKLKVDNKLEDNLEKIKMIRAAFGNTIEIRLDANTSWNLEEAEQLIPAYLRVGIYSFEQLFPKGQEEKMASLTAKFGTEARIMVDESLTSFKSAVKLVQKGYCNAFNIKISKTGGIFNALKIYNFAQAQGLTCQLGAHFGETSLLTRAGLLFAALSGPLTAQEGGFGPYLLEKDLCTKALHFDKNGTFRTGDLKQYSPLVVEDARVSNYS